MPYVGLPGVRLWYEDSGGSGVPVVFLHAASGTSASWAYQVPVFASAGYRCVTYDRRGWGRSQPEGAQPDPPRYASDDLRDLADALVLDRFHLVSTAAGSAVAVDFTLSYPARVRSLTIADCTGGVQDPEHLALLERIRPPEIQALPTELRELSAGYRGLDPDGTRRWVEILRASNEHAAARQRARNRITYAALEGIAVPTLVIAGEADLSTPPVVMRLLYARFPHGTWAGIPEAGHAAFWEQPEVWNRHVLGFIQAQAAG